MQKGRQEHTGWWASVSAYGILTTVGTGPTVQCGIWCERVQEWGGEEMPEDEETPSIPGWLGDGILQNGVDQGARYRAHVRALNTARQQKEDDRRTAQEARREAQEKAERARRAPAPREDSPVTQGALCGRAVAYSP